MKKLVIILLSLILITCIPLGVLGCDNGGSEDEEIEVLNPVSTVFGENIFPIEQDESIGVCINTDNYRFDIFSGDDGFSVRAVNKDDLTTPDENVSDSVVSFYSEKPIFLSIWNKKKSMDIENSYQNFYSGIFGGENGVIAKGTIRTENGSLFSVYDEYYVKSGLLEISRKVVVKNSATEDKGFSSRIFFASNVMSYDEEGDFEDLEYFIPSILYKDCELNAQGAAASFDSNTEILVKENRTGLPMVAGRIKQSGETLSIAHINPKISSDISDTKTVSYYCDENYKCGAVGIMRDPTPSICFVYPSSETYSYQSGYKFAKRFYPINVDFMSTFTVNVFGKSTDDFSDALNSTYRANYALQEKEIYDVDIDTVYDKVAETVSYFVTTKNYGGNSYTGIPYGCTVMDGELKSNDMEMGFVGMNLSLAYELMLYGDRIGNSIIISKGIAIANTWVNNSGAASGVVKPYMNLFGQFSMMPCYLRRMTDGMEGLLKCYLYQKEKGVEEASWFEMLKKYADFLTSKQELFVENGVTYGIWRRAYDYNGNMFTTDNPCGQIADLKNSSDVMADSTLSTPIPVRFLINMIKVFTDKGDNERAESCGWAAIYAGNYIIQKLIPMGKFAGAACDGADRTDRETGIFALYALNALYAWSQNQAFLPYMKTVATYVASWTVLYQYKTITTDGFDAGQAYTERFLTDGLSIISTGHSGVDIFMAYVYAEYFKLYVWTGDSFYYDFALFAQNNTKKILNLDYSMGFRYEGLCLEGTYLSEFAFYTASDAEDKSAQDASWLPWSADAVLAPIAEMYNLFGEADVRNLIDLPMEILSSYVSGN